MAPVTKMASHPARFTIQLHCTVPPVSGSWTSWLSPYSGGEPGEVLQVGGDLAERDEQAAGEAAQGQHEGEDLRDVLGGQQVAGEQAEGGEQQRSDPHAAPGDDPQAGW